MAINDERLFRELAETEISEYEYQLPVTDQLAKANVSSFTHLLQKIPKELRYMLTDFKEIQRCVVGVTPEIDLDNLVKNGTDFADIPYEEFEELSFYTNVPNSNMLVVRLPQLEAGNEDLKESYSLFNLSAVKRTVTTNYPSLFPREAREDTSDWLLNYTSDWRDAFQPTRYGLLSGFPLHAVTHYADFRSAFSILMIHEKSMQREENIKFLKEYLFLVEPMKSIKQRFLNIVDQATQDENSGIYNNEKELFIKSHNTGDFIGFDKLRDTAYIQVLNRIFQGSGITNLLPNGLKEI